MLSIAQSSTLLLRKQHPSSRRVALAHGIMPHSHLPSGLAAAEEAAHYNLIFALLGTLLLVNAAAEKAAFLISSRLWPLLKSSSSHGLI